MRFGRWRPEGKDLEHWLRNETEIAGQTYAGVTDKGKLVKSSETQVSKSPRSE
jgi:hypothetical protein